MPAIRKAKTQFIYVFALIVSGVFSFFGKTAPSWAREAEKDKSSKIFNEEFFKGTTVQESGVLFAHPEMVDKPVVIAQATFTDRSFVAFTLPKDRAFVAYPGDRTYSWAEPETMTLTNFFTKPEQVNTVNQQLVEMLQAIQAKIQGGEKLTEGEMALLVQVGSAK